MAFQPLEPRAAAGHGARHVSPVPNGLTVLRSIEPGEDLMRENAALGAVEAGDGVALPNLARDRQTVQVLIEPLVKHRSQCGHVGEAVALHHVALGAEE